MQPDSSRVKNIMVLMSDKHMGNFTVSLPAIAALRKFFKEQTFSLVADCAYREIAETINGIDSLILYPRQLLRSDSFAGQFLRFLTFVKEMRKLKPDITIDLEGRELSSTLAFLSGAPLRIGNSSAKRAFFYNKKIHLSKNDKHRIYKYIEIASSVGAHIDKLSFDLRSTGSKINSLETKLAHEGIKKAKPVACIHPGAGRPFREWTSAGFAEIADWLSSKGWQVVLIGGAVDMPKAHETMSLLKNSVFNLAGKLTLGELIALFELSSLYIGNDTGPLHLASAVSTLPVIGLYFRPGAEKTWYPFTSHSIVLRGDAGCLKCKGRHCELDFECTKKLSSDEVKSAIEKIMSLKMENRVT